MLDGAAETLKKNEDVKEFYLGLSASGGRSFRDCKKLQAAETVALGESDKTSVISRTRAGRNRYSALATLASSGLLQRQLRESIGQDRFGGLGQLADWREAWSPIAGRCRISSSGIWPPVPAGAARHAQWHWRSTASCRGMAIWTMGCGSVGIESDSRSCISTAAARPAFAGRRRMSSIAGAGPRACVGVTVRVLDYLGLRQSIMSRRPTGPWLWRRRGHGRPVRSCERAARRSATSTSAALAKIAIGLGRIFAAPAGAAALSVPRAPARSAQPTISPGIAPSLLGHRRTAGSMVTLTGEVRMSCGGTGAWARAGYRTRLGVGTAPSLRRGPCRLQAGRREGWSGAPPRTEGSMPETSGTYYDPAGGPEPAEREASISMRCRG